MLWFLFLFNLLIAIAAGIALHGAQQVTTTIGTSAASFVVGASLLLSRKRPAGHTPCQNLHEPQETARHGRGTPALAAA